MSPFLCNNFLSEITKCIFKHPSIKPHIIIVWVTKIILFAFLSLLDLFKSHKSSRVKKSSSRNLWRIHLSSFSLFFFSSYFNRLQSFLQPCISSVVSFQMRFEAMFDLSAMGWLRTDADTTSHHCVSQLWSAGVHTGRQELTQHTAYIAFLVAVAPPSIRKIIPGFIDF